MPVFFGNVQEVMIDMRLLATPVYYIETILFVVISCLIFVSVLFFVLTFYKKVNRIREIKRKKEYQFKIDELLFNLLFNGKTIDEIIKHPDFIDCKENKLFQQLTIKSLIGLHHNYSGIYSSKLEQFFSASGLADYSLNKLNSDNWSHIVEGIKDLSSLNYLKAYPRIVSYKNHHNKFVQTEVLLGMIKLNGISELLKFKNSNVYFNDWVQSNILYVVKKHRIPAPENLVELLKSKNESINILAIRLMNYYGLAEYNSELSGLLETSGNSTIIKEISLHLNKTEYLQ